MMGQAFSEPVTEKESSTERNETYCVASSSIQGWRVSMEDAHTIQLSLPDDEEASFFAVFDGHGGAKVANYASENLFRVLTAHQFYQEGRIEDALKSAFVEFDEMMFNDEKMRDELAGSTAVIVLIKQGNIYCANIGDSRAVASFAGDVVPLSNDHKPTCPDETNRIVSAGGWVQYNRVNGNLALSRAFGDFVFKRNNKLPATEQIVVAYPDVLIRPLTPELEFIVLCCDGVWDVMSNTEVVEFIRRRIIFQMEAVTICEELITRCLAPDCQMGFGVGCDNMTVILVCYLNGATYQQYCEKIARVNVELADERYCYGDRQFYGMPEPPPPNIDVSTLKTRSHRPQWATNSDSDSSSSSGDEQPPFNTDVNGNDETKSTDTSNQITTKPAISLNSTSDGNTLICTVSVKDSNRLPTSGERSKDQSSPSPPPDSSASSSLSAASARLPESTP